MKQHLGALTFLLSAAFAFGADVPPAEKLLPADTLGLVTVPDFSKWEAAASRSAVGRLLNDAALKPFREKFVGKLSSEIITPLEKELGLKFSDYTGLARGQVTLAFSLNGPKAAAAEEPNLGVTLLVDSRDKSGQLTTNLTALRKKWVDAGKQIRTDKIRDIEFSTLIFNSDDLAKVLDKVFPSQEKPDEPEKPTKVEWLMGQSGSLFILGNATKDIEKILVNQGGGSAGALAEQSSFAASQQSLFRDAQAFGWLNLKVIIEGLMKAANTGDAGGGGGAFGMSPEKIMGALGLTGLNAAGFSMRDTAEGSHFGFNIDTPESGRKGLLKMISFESKDASPPPFVPADAVAFSRLRLDLPKAWDTLEKTLTDAVPQMAGLLKMVMENAGKDQDPTFDLRKSLIQNLSDDLITIGKAPRGQSLEDLTSAPSLTLISSPKPEQLAGSIRALTALMPSQASKFKEREFLGRKVYALGLPSSMMPGGKAVDRTLHYSASGGYVALSTDIAILEEYLRSSDSPGKPLRDLPGLAEAAQKVGGMGTGLFMFDNYRETTRAQYETLKKEASTLANLFSGSPLAGRFGMEGNADKLKDWVDFSLLPPFDQIAKYFHHVVTAGSVTPQGISLKMFSAMSPDLQK